MHTLLEDCQHSDSLRLDHLGILRWPYFLPEEAVGAYARIAASVAKGDADCGAMVTGAEVVVVVAAVGRDEGEGMDFGAAENASVQHTDAYSCEVKQKWAKVEAEVEVGPRSGRLAIRILRRLGFEQMLARTLPGWTTSDVRRRGECLGLLL